MNAEELLNAANQASIAFQATMSEAERASLAAAPPATPVHSTMNPEDALLEFAAEGLADLAASMRTILDQRMEKIYRQALEVYYAAEELGRDPAHAELIPHIEAMRRGHKRDYGRGIPTREG